MDLTVVLVLLSILQDVMSDLFISSVLYDLSMSLHFLDACSLLSISVLRNTCFRTQS